MAISFVLSVLSSIEQVQEMELSNEEITEADNICLHNCILFFFTVVLFYGATFCCRFCFDFYELLM